MPIPPIIKGRYDIKEILGKGGMGVVYKSFDVVVKREVALKTVLDIADAKALELFHKEYQVLASISHPNIVEIFDLGEFEEEGEKIPYFVMPLLNGMTLDKLIRTSSHRLTVERSVEIISQTCRGLQAAHERGLIHRDLKPSNIFVMDDDSVRIIDFGVVHKADALSTKGWKGTLQYMAPELIEMKPPSILSDVFSVGAVAYETLTQRRPFERPGQHEILQAILHHIPPAASDLNAAVGQTVSQVIHKAMAKQPYHRFSSARELAETLQKALRGEPIEIFDPARIQPRIQRATKAFEQGDYQFADEILNELEAEGHIDPAITLLRGQLGQAIRQKRILQLLESARTRFEEEEYPLALQKVQQALELEPDNAAALSLQRDIEKRRTEGKIEDWFRLARQHIDNHAYSHARDALRNVLQLKPAYSQASQLLAEVDRLEEEYLALREEKERLYQAAMEAWKSGEVSSALHRLERALDLDRRAPDSSAPERSATYQNLYKQVRSEYDTMNSSYAAARKHLADRNLAKALAVCDEYLAKYPGHALFQALKFDVEEQQRQELSAYIADIDRQAEAEPDLGKRVNILNEALQRYPGEGHFERALRLMREKRDLVNSIVAKAQLLEERGQFNEALGQWEILQTIYSPYPGLNFEIERVIKRRDQQARSEAKARTVAQIDRELHRNDYRRALDLLKNAQAEFPNDAELAELAKLAGQGIERTAEAQRLFGQGQGLCAQRRFQEGVEILRKAHELDEANPAIQAALVDTLVEQARAVVDTDWRAADELTRQALELDPSHALGKSLRTLALDRKREESVDRCVAQARQLQAADDLEGALKQIEEGLASYPQNPRLAQLHSTLGIEILESQRRQARRRDLEELGCLDREAETASEAASAKRLSARAQDIARKYPDDSEVRSVAQGIEHRLASMLAHLQAQPSRQPAKAPPEPPKPGVVPPAKAAIPPAPAPAPTQETAVLRGTPLAPQAPPPLAKPAARKQPPAGAAPAPGAAKAAVVETAGREAARPLGARVSLAERVRRLPLRLVVPVAIALLVAVGFLGWRLSKGTTVIAKVPLEVHTSPPGATIRIDDKEYGTSDLQLEMPAGSYRLEALKDGYLPVTTMVNVTSEAPVSVGLTLQPFPQAVRLNTDLEAGQVRLDGEEVGELQEGEFTLDSVAPGSHTLEVSGQHGEAAVSFEVLPGAISRISSPVAAKELKAVVLSSLGSRAMVQCSFGPAKASLDGHPVGEVSADGMELIGLAEGAHELTLGEGKDQRKLVIEIAPVPTLTVSLTSDRNVGTLVVMTGEDGVRILLDGKEHGRKTRRGRLRIPNLEVREYSVQVSKEGYQTVPQQRAEIRKGEETRLEFSLVPVPTVASLVIQGALPGAQVALDGNLLGTVQADGSFSASNLEPGKHTLELRKEAYLSKRITVQFGAGEVLRLAGNEVVLGMAMGTLRLNLSPPDSQVTVSRPGESTARPVSETTLNLPGGSYILTARAPNYSSRSVSIQVVPGETKTVNLLLTEEKKGGMDDWDEPTRWKRDANWFVRRGGDFALFGITPTGGRFVFTVALRRGRRLQWVLTHTNNKNYILFQMDKEHFYRSQVRNGDTTRLAKVPHGLADKGYYTLQIRVTPNAIIHEAFDGRNWTTLDNWKQSDFSFVEGKFGFLISGGDEVGVSNFAFYPQ